MRRFEEIIAPDPDKHIILGKAKDTGVRGTRPVRKLDGTNASGESPFSCCGRASMARERGRILNESAMEDKGETRSVLV